MTDLDNTTSGRGCKNKGKDTRLLLPLRQLDSRHDARSMDSNQLKPLAAYIANINDEHTEVTGHVMPFAIFTDNLQTRQLPLADGQQIDITVRCSAHRTGSSSPRKGG